MNKIKKIIFNNFFLKFLSLLIAFLLWLNISESQKTKLEFVNFVDIKSIPQGYEIQRISPEKVIIVIEGSRNKLGKVEVSKIQPYVEASKLKEGKNVLPVKIKGVPSSFKVISVKPDKIIIYTTKKKGSINE